MGWGSSPDKATGTLRVTARQLLSEDEICLPAQGSGYADSHAEGDRSADGMELLIQSLEAGIDRACGGEPASR